MVLVIDGRYGARFDWPSFKLVIKEKVSPTHAEYIFAHDRRKRMLVFVREPLFAHYDSYRTLVKKHNGVEAAVRAALEPALPAHVDYDVMPFLAEVKTSTPIPWIRPFRDVTDIKSALQHRFSRSGSGDELGSRRLSS